MWLMLQQEKQISLVPAMNTHLKMVLVSVLFLWLIMPDPASAQKYPLEVSGSRMSGVETKLGIGDLDMEHDHASLILPVLPFDTLKLFVYLKEDESRLHYRGFADDVPLDGLSTPISLRAFPEKLINSTRGAIFAIPVGDATWVLRRDEILATDYEDVSAEDRGFMNQVLYRPKSNEKGKWFYGASHFGGIGKDSVYPLLGYTYNGDIVRVNSVLPSFFILQFKLSEHLYFLIDETVTAESYRLTEKAPWNSTYLTQMNLTSRLELGLRFSDLELGLSYGWTDIHSLTFLNDDHDELQKWELKGAPVTSLQLQWNL